MRILGWREGGNQIVFLGLFRLIFEDLGTLFSTRKRSWRVTTVVALSMWDVCTLTGSSTSVRHLVRHWTKKTLKSLKKRRAEKVFKGRVFDSQFDSSRTLVHAHLGPTGVARPDLRPRVPLHCGFMGLPPAPTADHRDELVSRQGTSRTPPNISV